MSKGGNLFKKSLEESVQFSNLCDQVQINEGIDQTEVKDILTCTVCYELVKNPVMCPKCQVMLCSDCFERVAKGSNFKCVKCREKIDKKNFINLKKIDSISSYIKQLSKILINEKKGGFCITHKNEKATYFCYDCKKSLCYKCFDLDDQDIHQNHKILSNELYKQINNKEKDLENEKGLIKKHIEDRKKISHFIETSESKLEDYLDELKINLKEKTKEKLNDINLSIKDLEKKYKNVENNINKIKNYFNKIGESDNKKIYKIQTNELKEIFNEEKLDINENGEIFDKQFYLINNYSQNKFNDENTKKALQEFNKINNIFKICKRTENPIKFLIFGKYQNGGDKYKGYINEKGVCEGFGEFEYQNGDHYEGKVSEEHFNGFGVFSKNNGQVFKGIWKNNQLNGIGTYKNIITNEKFIGNWKNNLRNGKGLTEDRHDNKELGNYYRDQKIGTHVFINQSLDSEKRQYEFNEDNDNILQASNLEENIRINLNDSYQNNELIDLDESQLQLNLSSSIISLYN